MRNLFSLDSPVIQWLGKVGQMMITGAIWLICCLPVFTVGAATTAMYRIMFNLKEDRSCALKEYFRAFRENFRKATILWLLILAAVVLLACFFYLVVLVEQEFVRMILLAVFCILFFVVYISALYLFPMTAYFENTVSGTIHNAVGMGLGNLRQSILACAITFIPLALRLVSLQLFVQLMILMVMLGPGAIAYGVVCALRPVFLRYVPDAGEVEE